MGGSHLNKGLPWWFSGKESACNAGDIGSIPWVGKIPWRRKWQPTPVFLPGEFHGQRSLMGYSPRGRKESDMTEQLHLLTLTPLVLRQSLIYSLLLKVLVAQSCPTLCDPMDCSPPGSSVVGILQARILGSPSLLQGIFPTQD